jgi:hypothetical protein
MTDLHEKELAEEIDREISDKGGLIALTVCLVAVIEPLVAGPWAILTAV